MAENLGEISQVQNLRCEVGTALNRLKSALRSTAFMPLQPRINFGMSKYLDASVQRVTP